MEATQLKNKINCLEKNKIDININIKNSIDSIQTYAYGTSKDLVSGKERLNATIQWNNTRND